MCYSSRLQHEWGAPVFLRVGDSCRLTRSFSEADVRRFGECSGDWNPVHYPDSYARVRAMEEEALRKEQAQQAQAAPSDAVAGSAAQPAPPASLPRTGIFRFPAPIVHGMLSASLISTLFATHMPGAVYLSQTLRFRAPVFYDQIVHAIVTVTDIDCKRRRVTCSTRVEKAGDKEGETIVVVDGEASVLLDRLQQPEL